MTTLLREQQGNIAILTLNRPEKLNALSSDLLAELSQALDHIKQDASVQGLIITGSGPKSFCAGADISRLAEVDAESGYQFACEGQAVFRQLETLGKPSIAAVNGFAFGGGCELAMSATIRIASSSAQFGQPEVKLGVIPGYGGTQRLARLVGKGRALDLCLSGRFIKAEEALAWGLVTHVCTQESLMDYSIDFMNSILKHAPLALRSVMEVIDFGSDISLTEALHLEAVHFSKNCATQDKREGVNAFLEKRPPVFGKQ